MDNSGSTKMAIGLLDLSDELLTMICAHAMTWQPPARKTPPTTRSAWHEYPTGVIAEQLSQNYRILLRPLRCNRRLYALARHVFLESNTIGLSLRDLRNSAIRLEQQPRNSQMLCTGNPDPLLATILHLQLSVSISDLRSPFSQPFARVTPQAENVAGVMWRSAANVRALTSEAEELCKLGNACTSLQSLHLVLKVDEWYLWDDVGPDFRSRSQPQEQQQQQHQNTPGDWRKEAATPQPVYDTAARYRGLAETVVALMAEVPVKMGTIAFHHWRNDVPLLDLREQPAAAVIDALLVEGKSAALRGRVARVRTANSRTVRQTNVAPVKTSWGASDDITR